MLYNKQTKKSKSCKRNAIKGESFCEKHAPMINAYTKSANRAIERAAK